MFTAKISFPIVTEAERTAEAAYDVLSCWYKNGQLVGDSWPLSIVGANVEAYVWLPDTDALQAQNNNVYANRALDELGPSRPTVLVIGKDPNLPASCSCGARSALVLFTTYLSETSPIRCLDCFSPVALYTLPHIEDHEHLQVLQWAADYRACDTLQMHCTTGERFGEEQLYGYNSSLSRHGRALGSKLEEATRLPVYYFLHKTRGRSRDAELRRLCPSCKANWKLESRLHLFDFQCPNCRLLSAIAVGVA